ncbi:hypothetical protein ACOZ4I_10520 [Haloarcula salina]|uniref:hypothetical protein n=1 Tax=Haloarcula salina TaxID=1429914 RepID=UPI003C6F449A
MSFLSGLRGGTDVGFDGYDEFVPDHLPEPGPFLTDADVLTGTDHAAFHRLTMDLFDERGVYDMTFGYNLAQLNLDQRHPDSGFRYARDGDVLRAAFTPTTEFCPQSDTLTVGAFRAWNGLSDRHEYDVVSVRVDAMHHQSEAINERLMDLESRYRETGELVDAESDAAAEGPQSDVDPSDDLPF